MAWMDTEKFVDHYVAERSRNIFQTYEMAFRNLVKRNYFNAHNEQDKNKGNENGFSGFMVKVSVLCEKEKYEC